MPLTKQWVKNLLNREIDGDRFPLMWKLPLDDDEEEDIRWLKEKIRPKNEFLTEYLGIKRESKRFDSTPSEPETQDCQEILQLLEVP